MGENTGYTGNERQPNRTGLFMGLLSIAAGVISIIVSILPAFFDSNISFYSSLWRVVFFWVGVLALLIGVEYSTKGGFGNFTLPLYAALITIYFASFGIPGDVTLLPPSRFAVIRGVEWSPSDNLLIHTVWKNTSGQERIVRQPYLVLSSKETKNKLVYVISGEYSSYSRNKITTDKEVESYDLKSSFTLKPNSFEPKILLFKTIDWWDTEKESRSCFHFEGGEKYKITIHYTLDAGVKKEKIVLKDRQIIDKKTAKRLKSRFCLRKHKPNYFKKTGSDNFFEDWQLSDEDLARDKTKDEEKSYEEHIDEAVYPENTCPVCTNAKS